MKEITLVPLDQKTISALTANPARFESDFGIALGSLREMVRGMAAQTAAFLTKTPRSAPWGAYLVVDAATHCAVGTCAFKDAPAPDEGSVEIAYFTFPPYEEKGFATAMAARLVEIAFAVPAVCSVVAHTLPEVNASVTVLKKIGMELVGEVTDPDEGAVWRWERRRVV